MKPPTTSLDARRSIDLQRRLRPPATHVCNRNSPSSPMWSECKCVMQHAVDLLQRNAPQQQIARAVDAGIDEIELPAGRDHRARPARVAGRAAACPCRTSSTDSSSASASTGVGPPDDRRDARPGGTATCPPTACGSQSRPAAASTTIAHDRDQKSSAHQFRFLSASVRSASGATTGRRAGPVRRTARLRTPWSARPNGRRPDAPSGCLR